MDFMEMELKCSKSLLVVCVISLSHPFKSSLLGCLCDKQDITSGATLESGEKQGSIEQKIKYKDDLTYMSFLSFLSRSFFGCTEFATSNNVRNKVFLL